MKKKTPSPGTYERTPEHRENMSRTMLESWERRKNLGDKHSSAIASMDREKMTKALAQIDEEILTVGKEIGRNLVRLRNLRERRDKIEERMEALGMRLYNPARNREDKQ